MINKLKAAGVEVDGILARLGGNEVLYLSICNKFVKDSNYSLYLSAISSEDRKSAEVHVHTLKGIAANLGLKRLSMLCNTIIEDFNINGNVPDEKNQELKEEYHKIISILNNQDCKDEVMK